MARAITIAATLVSAGLFAWVVPLARLFDAFQPMITALSIMIAAVLVRLNRGMPTLEWKSLDPQKRKDLTTAIVGVTTEYGWIIGVIAVVLAWLVALDVIGKTDAGQWPEWGRRLVSGSIGAFGSVCVARMGYVVWRDIDIARLQKQLIDDISASEASAREAARADETVANIRSAGVRPVEVKAPKAWGE